VVEAIKAWVETVQSVTPKLPSVNVPLADKLHLKLVDEEINRTLMIDGVLMIRDSKSPTLVREMLLAYLPEKHRHEAEPEPAPA